MTDEEYYAKMRAELKKLQETYDKCAWCGKYDMPPSVYSRNGRTFEDDSMVCNGVLYMQVNPFAAEIDGDHTLVMMCDGEAARLADDI